MGTAKSAMRSYGVAVRKIEREQQRQVRESTKQFKKQQKLQEIVNAQQAASVWENYIDTIQSLHKNCTQSIDWDQIKNTKEPIEPKQKFINKTNAENKLDQFKPSLFDKIFGLTQKKTNKLTSLLELAKEKDIKENNINHKIYIEEFTNWKELQKISYGVGKKDTNSYKKALSYFKPFSDIGEFGTEISFNFENNYIDTDIQANSSEVIPDYELKQTSTGKLSKKSIVKSRFNELYQDHICSAAIRVAREVFAYLPIEYARINAVSKILNSKTGHLENLPILSVIFLPETIKTLNLKTIDPSGSLQNFVHNMKFSKTKGFSIIEKVELSK